MVDLEGDTDGFFSFFFPILQIIHIHSYLQLRQSTHLIKSVAFHQAGAPNINRPFSFAL